ncbi:MAG: phosphatidate cytidylyltransferase [Bacteroidetes bacterium]|nr:phosphatidate cytidylyltransferase [Bacteroidota bacterium]
MLSIEKIEQNKELSLVIAVILGILVFATVLFFIWGKIKPEANLKELKARTRSWWIMAGIFITATLVNTIVSFIAFTFLSIFAFKELTSISRTTRVCDKNIISWGYAAIPVQYFFAYMGWYEAFLIFIPVFMTFFLTFLIVKKGVIKHISISMAVIPMQLMLCVYGISHLAYLLSLSELQGFKPGGRGLLLFVVFITEMNDVFQFTWGKFLGKRKVIPLVSPNKTWEGLIGGVITTTVVGYFLRFLTPLNGVESIVVSFVVACVGFAGDIMVSAIKRDIGVKDMGSVIPGHGGILDRIDSLALTAPIFFHILYFLKY